VECPPHEHDEAVALISHLPVLVGAALLQAADRGAAPGPQDLVRTLASSGFADTTRVGGGNPELGALMARCNRPALRRALAHYRSAFDRLDALVEQERWQELQAELEQCRRLRSGFL
jgi:arogenate dehydrogenase (NADP+)